jgi:CRP/FNR family transcriptional regulator, cyclic AMP receptor protein
VVPEQSLQLLGSLSEEDRRMVLRRCHRTRYPAGAFVYHAGQQGDALHVITKGRVTASAGGALGEPVTLAIMGVGEAFGEMALIDPDHTRTATIRAIEPTETLVLQQGDFDELRRRGPAVNELLIRVLVARVRRLTDQVAELNELPAPARIHRRLLALGELFEVIDTDAPIPISQNQLASLAGTKLRVTNKVLSDARVHGVLETRRRRIFVHDWRAVRRAARVRVATSW